MGQTQVIGVVLIVVGVGLGFWGFQESGSVASQLSQTFSGSPSDDVMIKYIAGAASAAAGAFLYVRS